MSSSVLSKKGGKLCCLVNLKGIRYIKDCKLKMRSELISYVNNDSLFLFKDINGSNLFLEIAKRLRKKVINHF